MGKRETVEKYLPLYLQGLSEERKAKFLSRDVNKQYASIMTWRSRENKKQGRENGFGSLISAIDAVSNALKNVGESTPEQLESCRERIRGLEAELDRAKQMRKEAIILELETEQRKIAEKLASLRD